MRVEQQNGILEMLQQNGNVENKGSNAAFAEKASASKSKYSERRSVFIKDSTYLNPAKEEKHDLAETLETETALDATDRKNQMAVLSHTTSEEDYVKMQEEGFSLDDTVGNTIVTVTDKIKMQIAKAGGDISYFGDDLTMEQLEKMTGNKNLAQQLEQKLLEADLPVTEENLMACAQVYALAAALQPLGEGGMKYMLDNQLEPTIENLYKAVYSGSANYAVSGSNMDITGMQSQIEEVIKEAGFSVNEQTLADSKWLLANELALTAENLSYLKDLREYTGTFTEEEFASAAVAALAEGKSAKEALALSGYDWKSQAKEAVSIVETASDEDIRYLIDRGFELTIKNLKMAQAHKDETGAKNGSQKNPQMPAEKELQLLTARRQLEEIRLTMTTEASYALLKRGISIDTKPLVELVEDLKNQENQYYADLLEAQGVDAAPENVELFADTTEKLEAIKSVPAYVLGIPQAEVSDIEGVYENGTALKAAMEKANQKYEPLLTAPRSDMGDSYSKAFQNVDDILADLNLEQNDANRRAVRILAYNQIEITEETIVQMKAADEEVQRVFKNLTPSVVIEMIRKGENPLEMDFSMLNQTAENIKQELNQNDTERFSEFLWKLEKNKEITEEERSSFVGVYRLLHQIERTDGAAIGAVLNQGAELTLKNLLTAVRSAGKQKKMDVSVDDAFGTQENTTGYENSITDQIMAGFQQHCIKDAKEALTPGRLAEMEKQGTDWMALTPEQFAAALQAIETEDTGLQPEYVKEQLERMKQCANASKEVYQFLEKYDIPNSVQNILAAEELLSDRNGVFRKLFVQQEDTVFTGAMEGIGEKPVSDEIEEIKRQLIKEFGEAVSEPKELAKAQEELAKLAENVMKTMIESGEVTSVDIREAKLMCTQIAIQKQMAKDETYSVPVLVGDEITNVTLKIVHGVEKRGMVDIMLETQLAGKIAATFQADEKGIHGLIATDRMEAKEDMAVHMETFLAELQESGTELVDVRTAYISDLDLNHFSNSAAAKENQDVSEGMEKAPEESDAHQVKTARLYKIAESFIRTVRACYK